MWRLFKTIVARDLLLALRRRTEILMTLFFFIVVISLFPLGIGTERQNLILIAPGVAWVAALLASVLVLDRLFSADYLDGTLEQMLLTAQPLSVVVMAKVCAHWLLTGLPLVLISPLVALQYRLGDEQMASMMLSLLLGTPALSMIGAIGAALTLGLRGGGILLSLLILPLYIPVLVYGAGAIAAGAVANAPQQAYYMLLGAFTVLSMALAPWVVAVALRFSLE